ncbi:sodium:solute symporter [Sphingopyxis sp. FD7]|uniref:sodium:solute symporter n=1 Tax=Sphingopyxis sp. FD7 TaxID=1914525 RepID=UPI000DC61E1E|nr:sodium:solute symporter [Sphingopyxis sp. FD7]BBB14321.1 SSS sodium solute transporter superfamily protein [Sphingopyxis sp. FD7]
MVTLLRHFLFASLAWLVMAAPSRADDNVSALRTRALPALQSDGSRPTLLVLDGRPVVIQASRAAIAAEDGSGWRPVDARALADLEIVDVSGDGTKAAITTRDGRAFVATIRDGRIALQPLPPSPVRGATRITLLEDVLTLVGQARDGTNRLVQLPLTEQPLRWVAVADAPRGEVTALVGQAAALYLTTIENREQRHWRWAPKTGWVARTAPPLAVAGTSRAIGQAGILYLAQGAGSRTWITYNTITDAWSTIPADVPNAASAVALNNGMVTLEQRGGRLIATDLQLEYQRRALGVLDWSIITAYLVAMLAIGFYFWSRSRMGSTSEFFLGSRTIPFWAAGISMFATNTSSISYLAVPAKAFDTDWQYMMSKVVTVFALMAVAYFIIPMFRRLNLVSVFGYLESRFHPTIRMLSSALAILMHVGGRMGIVLFLPALAIGTITGTNVILCILVIGVCTIVYTALGGMKAVVWTDFFQVVVLFGGAFFAIGFIVYSIGAGQIYDTAMQFDKTKMLNFSFDFTTPTIWGFIILYTFDTVLTFPKDQVLMQRVLSTPDEKEASRSVWFFALILMPAGFVFYIIGTTLFAYYRANPGRLDPLLPVDAVFPAFIGTELPQGVTGIIIAGLFAAAMGTLSGTINSVATLLSVDFYEKFRREPPTQKQSVRFAEWMTVLIGVVGIVLAVILSRLDVRSLLDLTIELFGLLGGSCAGAYTLGMFTKRANWQGTAIGIVAATVLTLVCWLFSLVHPYFYLAIAIVASIAIGYVASLFFPAPRPEQLKGLTIYDKRPRPDLEVERLA